ncbi:MAG: killer suppression protein [Deltaproteobacteria bacterium]
MSPLGLLFLASDPVDILYNDSRLQKLCTTHKDAKKKWGNNVADRLFQRIADLSAAPNLFHAFRLPGKCHGLSDDLAGTYAMRLDGGWRFIFEPANDPVPVLPDGGIDVNKVTIIRIVSVEDYHP